MKYFLLLALMFLAACAPSQREKVLREKHEKLMDYEGVQDWYHVGNTACKTKEAETACGLTLTDCLWTGRIECAKDVEVYGKRGRR